MPKAIKISIVNPVGEGLRIHYNLEDESGNFVATDNMFVPEGKIRSEIIQDLRAHARKHIPTPLIPPVLVGESLSIN